MFVDPETQKTRYGICVSCEHFVKLSKQCKLCYCFMKVKTKLKGARCPELKWDKVKD